MTICVFGLGETGSRLAADLLSIGVDVFAYDPAVVETPLGAVRASHPALAVARADVVVATVPGSQAELALLQCLEAIRSGVIYADASQASSTDKVALAELASRHGVPFVDLQLLADGPRRGVAMGEGSEALAKRLETVDYRIEVSGRPVGSARMQRSIERVALAGFGVVLDELLAAATDDERRSVLQRISDALNSGSESWAIDLIDQVTDPPADLATEAADTATYLRQQGTLPIVVEALVQRLSES